MAPAGAIDIAQFTFYKHETPLELEVFTEGTKSDLKIITKTSVINPIK